MNLFLEHNHYGPDEKSVYMHISSNEHELKKSQILEALEVLIESIEGDDLDIYLPVEPIAEVLDRRKTRHGQRQNATAGHIEELQGKYTDTEIKKAAEVLNRSLKNA